MRARPREINIFNMSLLDILCGALGAFCFMMLVALPYYVVGKVDRAESQKRTEELLKNVEKLREQMSDPAQAEELRKLIEELEARIKQLQGEVNQLSYENDQLRDEKERLANENEQLRSDNERLAGENSALRNDNLRLKTENEVVRLENTRLTAEKDNLQKENERQKRALATRKPFMVMAGATEMSQDVAIYLEDQEVWGETDKAKLANTHFEPDALIQPSRWQDDLSNIRVERRGVTLWVSSTTCPNSSYRVFVKYNQPPLGGNVPFSDSHLRPTPVYLSLYGDFAKNQRFFHVNLTPQRYWVLAGVLSVDDDAKLTFKEATEEERKAAWTEYMKTEAPTPSATPTPAPTLSREEMDRLRQKAQEERKRIEEERARRKVTPAPMISDEGRARREQAVQERLQAVSPSPTP